jgi:DNA (cytosine-5-)-methyltransferase
MRCVDLFCGCGGLSLGFARAGFTVEAAFDNWEVALAVYRNNFTHPAIQLDLSDTARAVGAVERFKPQMIIGGPPCQDFSSAGKRDENNGRGDLTIDYARIVAGVRPEWFVMENVARITKTQKLIEAKGVLKAAGYGVSQAVLDACRCGVPQKRKRFFMVGRLRERDGFLDDFLGRNLAAREMTVADALGSSLGIEYYYRHPRSYARRGIFSIHEPSPTIRGVNRPIPSGYTIHHNDPVKELAGVRPLTTRERCLIQTFPANFRFGGSRTEQEQMLGNAVPVNLGRYVGRCIQEYVAEVSGGAVKTETSD